MQNRHNLDSDNIGKLLNQLSVPATVGMLVMTLYNLIDTIFVGNVIGTAAIAALAIVFPLQTINSGIGQMVGIGGASLLSRSLGANDHRKASKTVGNVLSMALFAGAVISIGGLLALDPLLSLFGATSTILPLAKEYAQIILLFTALPCTAMALNHMVRAEGKAKIAMMTMIISAVSNIILDAIFILVFHWGIRGVAAATAVAHVISFSFLLFVYLSGKSMVRIKTRDLKWDFAILKEIFGIGIASFVRQSALSVLTIIMNRTLSIYGGDLAIAVYGILFRIIMLIFMPLMGIAQGMQPVVGFNYGARRYDRLQRSITISLKRATFLASFGTGIALLFPAEIFRLFSSDPALIENGTTALRYSVLAFPLVGFHVVGNTVFQALGKTVPNFILSISRQIFFFLPLLLILPNYLALNGVWISFPISDTLSALLTLALVLHSKRKYDKRTLNSTVAVEG